MPFFPKEKWTLRIIHPVQFGGDMVARAGVGSSGAGYRKQVKDYCGQKSEAELPSKKQGEDHDGDERYQQSW